MTDGNLWRANISSGFDSRAETQAQPLITTNEEATIILSGKMDLTINNIWKGWKMWVVWWTALMGGVTDDHVVRSDCGRGAGSGSGGECVCRVCVFEGVGDYSIIVIIILITTDKVI